ncbi:MAG: hypothetical protein IT289_02865 [Oligoflexia bacterium]|nr:hypothetical protein [Oligoflexia bacterium]
MFLQSPTLNADPSPTPSPAGSPQVSPEDVVNALRADSRERTEAQKRQDAINACESAYSTAERACVSGGVIANVGGQLAGAAAGREVVGQENSMLAHCRAMISGAKVAKITSGLAAAACVGAVMRCRSVCNASRLSAAGVDVETNTKGQQISRSCSTGALAAVGVGGAAAAYAQAQAASNEGRRCEQYVNDYDNCKPGTAGARDNPRCKDYCLNPVHKFEPTCVECMQPDAENNPRCPAYCANPLNQKKPDYNKTCPGGEIPPLDPGGIDGGGVANSDGMPGDLSEPGFNPSDFIPDDLLNEPKNGEFAGVGSEGKGSPFLSNDDGGGGGGFGGLGAYPGGPGSAGKEGDGKGGYKTDIEKGLTGASGGGMGGGFGPGGAGFPGAGGAGGAEAGADLSKYLPGGELDPAKRDPAALASANGITAADGLSNFEKINRMMNKKRPALKPGS